MFCSKCGMKAVEQAIYCSACGTKLGHADETEPSVSHVSNSAMAFPASPNVPMGQEEVPSIWLYKQGSEGVASNAPPIELDLGGDIPNSAIAARTIWLRRLLFLYIVVCAASLWGSWTEYGLLKDFSEGNYLSVQAAQADAEASDSLNAILGGVQLIYYFSLGVVFLTWIKAASANVRSLGAARMEFTPGWSIGWYFVPILSLWKPYQAMKELWQASDKPSDWQGQEAHPILVWWWFLWIFSLAIGNGAFRLAMQAEEIDELVFANIVGQVSLCVDILLTVVALKLVTGIGRLQGWASEKIYSES